MLGGNPLHPQRARTACKHTVSGSISLRSRGAFHLSLTVLVHYRSLSVFSLGGWSPLIPTGFHVPRGTWDAFASESSFVYGAVTRCGRPFQTSSTTRFISYWTVERPATPDSIARTRFRLLPGRSPLLGESRLISFPRPTEMFQFRRCPPLYLWIQYRVTGHYASRVAPFGYPRIYACLRLPEAFRSLPRPSSALSAKASTVCP
jgi:hypothetical protein